jgi:hypothetical protein
MEVVGRQEVLQLVGGSEERYIDDARGLVTSNFERHG